MRTRSVYIWGSFTKTIEHGEVAEVTAGAADYWIALAIHSHKSRRDFNPNDKNRFSEIIVHTVTTPGQAEQTREAIQQYAR
jgi:hypothetical protein